MRLPVELAFYVVAFTMSLGGGSCVWANTEIVNFAASPGPDAVLPKSTTWPELSPRNPELLLSVQPAPLDTPIAQVCEPLTNTSLGTCAHEAWLALDLDDPAWQKYRKYTLRVSWPASSPADFSLDIIPPASLAQSVYGADAAAYHVRVSDAARTRRAFARIRLVSTGVFTPPVPRNATPPPVAFIVILEPLILGVLPKSLIPTVGVIVAVAGFAILFVVPFVLRYLGAVAEQVRKEVGAGAGDSRKDR